MPRNDIPGDPIRKSVTVPLAPDAAFALFTEEIDVWWPKDTHSLSSGTGNGDKARIRVEPRTGGRVIETMPDGREAAWADVTCWQPGKRFGMRWYVGRSPDEATIIDIRFARVDGGTRVDLVHSGFAILGPKATELCANYTRGWDRVLEVCFGGHCVAMA